MSPMTRGQTVIVLAVAQAIKEATETSVLKGIPAGHLYSALMPTLTLESFESVIRALVDIGFVKREKSHLLVWIGPTS